METATTKPPNNPPKLTFWQSFRLFLKQYSVIGLAIGIIMGTAVNTLVQAIVQGLIMPLIGLLIPNRSFQTLVFHARGLDFRVGDVLSAMLQFIIIALLVFFVVKKLLHQDDVLNKERK